jgi:monoamine oxidase
MRAERASAVPRNCLTGIFDMARTPLLQTVLDACALAAAEARQGVPADRILEEHASGRVSRRRFLGVAAAGVGLAACDATERMVSIPPRGVRVPAGGERIAIIGAGLAGLTCAYRLRERGVIATIYEGSDRAGGRCRTRRGDFAAGQVAEHGGELIDQSHKHIRQLAQSLGLTLDNVLRAEVNGTEPFYYFDGSRYTYRDATRDIKAIWQTLHRDLSEAGYPTLYHSSTARGRELDQLSIAEWIDVSVPGGRAAPLGRLLETAYVIEFGEEATEQSALNLIYLLGFSGQGQLRIFGPSNEKYHVRGGNDRIVTGLVERLDGQLVTNAALAAIERTPAGAYLLSFAGGQSPVTADRVVLAIPSSVMRATVDFSNAGFSPLKQKAIAELGMGTNAKLNVQFARRHWATLGCNGDSYADTGYQATWEVSRAQAGTPGILVDYTGGDVARAQSGGGAATLAAQFLAQLEPVLPGTTAEWNGLATFDDWLTNPWTLGSYSFWRVGQYTSIAGVEGERSANCHFAGEHTSIDFQGYLNGAVESGERVAAEVFADLRAVT